ncbi:MAG: exo-alpha-sialidase, partial [Flavobacteriales bacterium]|nr:exo-alpha-sialidase [Flavobacteriales bacterium]
MNKTKIILGAATIAAIAGGVYLSRTIGNQSIKNYKMSSHFEEEYEEEEEKEEFWGEARKYWEFLHTNVNTGQVEVADYLNAKNLALSIPRTKTGLVFSEMGPDNIGGRTRAIEIDPNNDNLVFAGSVSGGLFVSTDQGNNWNRVQGFDDAVPVTSISSIAISKNSTIYVGCGFSDFSDGFQTCQGIYFSTDGGANWSQLSGTSGKCVNKIVADRSKTDAIYYTAGSGNYLTRVENASTGTATSTSIGTSAGITVQGSAGRDIKISPDGQNLLYLSSNKVYVSNDGGATFSDKTGTTTGLVNATGMNRLEGAVSFDKTSNGKYTMSIVMSSSGNWGGAYFSKDNGVTWSQIAPKWVNNANIPTEQQFNPLNSGGRSPQGNYDLVCTIVPGDPYTMVLGGIDLYRWRMTPNSNPVAGQFERITFWYLWSFMPNYVHADNHRLTWSQDGKLFTGSDGGVSKSLDTSLSVFSVSNKGYNVTQFYGISYGPDGEGIGGAQDNGTLYNENPEWNKSSLEMTGGDGFECELSQLKNGAFVSSIYFSDIYRASSYTSGVASIAAPCGTSTHGLDCGSFSTILRLYEDDNDLDSKDFIEYHTDTLMPTGSVITYQSANFDLPLTYTLTAPLTAGSTIDLQDPVQSLFITGTGTGIYITRDLW